VNSTLLGSAHVFIDLAMSRPAMEPTGIVLPVTPRALGGMFFSRSQRLWFSLLSKIINMSKLLSSK
jgi:hypothetical protein